MLKMLHYSISSGQQNFDCQSLRHRQDTELTVLLCKHILFHILVYIPSARFKTQLNGTNSRNCLPFCIHSEQASRKHLLQTELG